MESYNGWTNYETWNWNLWVTNDEATYGHWIERAEASVEAEDDHDSAIAALAAELDESADADASDFLGERIGPFADILNAGVNAINWWEIAEHFIDAVAERATHYG